MQHINPQQLRRLRESRGLSRRELAEESNVSEKQIQRLEDPQTASRSVRQPTVERLAHALGISRETLAGPSRGQSRRKSISLNPGALLAYDLVGRHYGIKPRELVNIAPLLFVLLAEGSLLWRQEELDELKEKIKRLLELDDDRRRCVRHAFFADEETGYEQAAIDQGNVFNDPYPASYELEPADDWEGPFGDYLRKLADDIGDAGLAEVGAGSECVIGSPGLPSYTVCRADLTKIAPSGSDALFALHAGDVRLSDIPDSLDDDAREAWLEAQLSPESRQWLDEQFPLPLESVGTENGDQESPSSAKEAGNDR